MTDWVLPFASFTTRLNPSWLVLLASLLCANPAFGDQSDPPLPVRVEIPAGRVYVGQAIEARVLVTAGSVPPKLTFGNVPAVDVVALGGVEVVPRASTSIGTRTETTNLYRFPVRIVVRRSGTHPLPQIRASIDERTGIATSRSITAVVPPSAGRTSTFLGGVGRMAVRVEAVPESMRLGESFELRIRLDGPGSISSVEPSASAVLGRDGASFRVESLPAEVAVNPPSRTFRYRVRPDRAGLTTIPPFRVSTFDPASSTYQTFLGNAVRMRVVDVPAFDERDLTTPPITGPGRGRTIAGVLAGIALALAGVVVAFARWKLRRDRWVNPSRTSAHLIAGLRSLDEDDRIGEAVVASLATYLNLVGGRPPGALTPEEARRSVIDLTGSSELGQRAARLVADCDRTLYAGGREAGSEGSVRESAIRLLAELADVAPRAKPREAPGTA